MGNAESSSGGGGGVTMEQSTTDTMVLDRGGAAHAGKQDGVTPLLPGLVAHIACRVDSVVHVAELASYIRTWRKWQR